MTFVNLFTTAARPEIASVHKSGTKLKLRAAWKSVGPAAPIRTRPVHTQISPHTPGYPGRHGYLLVQTKLEPKWVPTDWYSRKYSYKAYLFGVPCSGLLHIFCESHPDSHILLFLQSSLNLVQMCTSFFKILKTFKLIIGCKIDGTDLRLASARGEAQ